MYRVQSAVSRCDRDMARTFVQFAESALHDRQRSVADSVTTM